MELQTPQRSYRAPCPGCGAPVEFRSAQSTHAVCSYCRSTVVRSGETLARVGKMAELFDDHSPLQLMAAGRFGGKAFTLVGRLQYRSGSGTWSEWQALFDDGAGGQLAEDNGAYVFSFPGTLQREIPEAPRFRLDGTTAVAGKPFTVTTNDQAVLIAAQGELPRLPPLGQPFAMVELRSDDGEVLSIDYGATPPTVGRGREVRLEDLALTGLAAESARDEKARQFACPHCGAPVEVQLEGTRSITCRSCNSLIDLSQGIGGELRHAIQDEPVQPLIPLGATGTLQAAEWQVVGFQHRMGWQAGEEDDRFGWSEYLLFNRKRGFVFLVDSQEGWSLVRPVTGAPSLSAGGNEASYLGARYALKESYTAETDYVAGEFYWPVERGQRTANSDFTAGKRLLSMERSAREATWSSGGAIPSDAVVQAFKLQGKGDQLRRGDAGPTSTGGGVGCGCATLIVVFIVIIFLVILFEILRDDRDSGGSGGVRSSGGSWGGSSSGGGHK